MLNRKQVVVVGLVVVLMAALYSLDIKGLTTNSQKQQAKTNQHKAGDRSSRVTLESVSILGKQTLNEELTQQITYLEEALIKTSGMERLQLQKQLAQRWDDVNIPAPSAFYWELIAKEENTYRNWLMAGDRFTSAYQYMQDTLVQPALIQKAILAYQKAEALRPTSLDPKIGLGVAYVTGSSDPMKGILLLRDVVKEDPKNIKANMSLGLFSMRTGQYEKAIARFKVVTSQTGQSEAWFYLASSYENIGMKEQAIAAYIKTKELATDPNLDEFVDRKVKELKKIN